MQKSFVKRIKTKKGRKTKGKKFVRRSMAVNHFRTRKSTNNIRGKRKTRSLDYPTKKILDYANTVV